MGNELNYKEIWDGEHRGVKFEVMHWYLGWNYYLYIPVMQLPFDVRKLFNLRGRTVRLNPEGREHILYEYGRAPIISDLDWHGGITLYEKQRDERGNIIGYRLGCDYMHYWDKGRNYDFDYVVMEAKHSIDKLHELVPNLLYRCAYNGEYYPEDKTYLTDKVVRVALENKTKWEKPIGVAPAPKEERK